MNGDLNHETWAWLQSPQHCLRSQVNVLKVHNVNEINWQVKYKVPRSLYKGLGVSDSALCNSKIIVLQNEADAALDPGVLPDPLHDGPGLWRLLGRQTPDQEVITAGSYFLTMFLMSL